MPTCAPLAGMRRLIPMERRPRSAVATSLRRNVHLQCHQIRFAWSRRTRRGRAPQQIPHQGRSAGLQGLFAHLPMGMVQSALPQPEDSLFAPEIGVLRRPLSWFDPHTRLDEERSVYRVGTQASVNRCSGCTRTVSVGGAPLHTASHNRLSPASEGGRKARITKAAKVAAHAPNPAAPAAPRRGARASPAPGPGPHRRGAQPQHTDARPGRSCYTSRRRC